MKLKKSFLSILCFLSMGALFAQNCNTIVSAVSLDDNIVYYEYTLFGNGQHSIYGCVPLNTSVKIKLTVDCSNGGQCSNYYFSSGDMNGNCDNFDYAISHTEFVTSFEDPNNMGCSPIVELKSCIGDVGIPIKLCPPEENPGGGCKLDYVIERCCDMYCVKFKPENSECRCFCVKIKFTDGSTTSFYVNSTVSDYSMNCFSKEIASVVSITPTNICGGCNQGNQKVAATEQNYPEKIILSPNPTKSTVSFSGENLEQYKISIYDASGNVLLKEVKMSNKMSLEKYKKGIYMYTITDENGYMQKGKIVKE